MARRVYSRRVLGSRSNTAKHWGAATNVVNAGTAGASYAAWAIAPNDVSAFDEYTLLRAQLLFHIHTGGTSPAGGVRAAAGLIVASGDNDVATLPTLFQDPATDADADWIIRFAHVIAPSTPQGNSAPGLDWQSNSKAKRRIATGEGLLLVVENDSTITCDMFAEVRFLIMSK